MNKKYLSALLFGALTLASTGTFTSCKDYDDEIEDLQGQIDKLATKEELSTQIASLESALNTAKSEAAEATKKAEDALAKAESAESTATEAEQAAKKAALEAAAAKEEAIAKALEEVKKVKTELEATIDSKFEAVKTELAKTVQDLTDKVEELTGMATGMITSLDLQWNHAIDFEKNQISLNWTKIGKNKFENGEYTFGEGLQGSFTLKNGQVFAQPDTILVSVSPANAALPSEILSLVDTEGNGLGSYLNLSSTAFTGKMQAPTGYSRSSKNGLYQIAINTKEDVNMKEFDEKIGDDEGSLQTMFAIAATKDERVVTSTYDLTISSNYQGKLDPAIGVGVVSTIKSSISKKKTFSEVWGSDEMSRGMYNVANGEPFEVVVSSLYGHFPYDFNSPILASYVQVDYESPSLSESDKLALKNVVASGDFNKVSKDNKFNLVVSGEGIEGIEVPLKVTYIDYTGTESSVSISVKPAGESTIEQTLNYFVKPTTYVSKEEAVDYDYECDFVAIEVPANAVSSKVEFTSDDLKNNTSWEMTYYAEANDAAEALNLRGNADDINFAKLSIKNLNLLKMIDNQVYEGVVKFYDANHTFISQSAIKLQKVLPTALPEGFGAKTNALDGDILTVYPTPVEDGIYAGTGVFEFKNAFNGIYNDETEEYARHFIFSSKDVELMGDATHTPNAKFVNDPENGYSVERINPDFIGNNKTYGAYVAYDYGYIRSTYVDAEGQKSNQHIVAWGTKFNIKFGCMIADATYSWTAPKVIYKEMAEIKTSTIKVTDAYNKVMTPFGAPKTGDENWSTWAEYLGPTTEIHVVTKANGNIDEYFTAQIDGENIVLTPKSKDVVVSDKVPSTLVIKVVDKFGKDSDGDGVIEYHSHDIKLDFDMLEKPAK